MKKESLSVLDGFELVSRYDGVDAETMAEIQEDLAELETGARGIDSKRITIPNGSSKAFTVETDDPDDPDAEKTIEGVVLFHHKMNVYWDTAFGETAEVKAPTCSSMDGEIGCVYETGETRKCATCPYNQYIETADGFTRKACKNTRRIYLVMSGKPYIYLLTVPPTSLKDVTEGLKSAVTRGRLPLSRMVMRFKLTSAVSKGGIAYNKVTVEPCGILPADVTAAISDMKSDIKESYQLIAASAEDLLTSGASAALPDGKSDEFQEVQSATDADLPF